MTQHVLFFISVFLFSFFCMYHILNFFNDIKTIADYYKKQTELQKSYKWINNQVNTLQMKHTKNQQTKEEYDVSNYIKQTKNNERG